MWPSFRRSRASFAAAVVLPEPWRPASRITVGGLLANASFESPLPIRLVSSSWTISTTSWPGVRLFVTSAPSARARTARDELLDDLEVDVGLEQGETDLAHRTRDRRPRRACRGRERRREPPAACLTGCRTRPASVLERLRVPYLIGTWPPVPAVARPTQHTRGSALPVARPWRGLLPRARCGRP